MLILIFHIRLWTFLLALVATIFFTTLERYGFSLAVFLRWLRLFIAGPRKMSQPWWKKCVNMVFAVMLSLSYESAALFR